MHKHENMGARVETILHANLGIQTMLSLRQCNHEEIKQKRERETETERSQEKEEEKGGEGGRGGGEEE